VYPYAGSTGNGSLLSAIIFVRKNSPIVQLIRTSVKYHGKERDVYLRNPKFECKPAAFYPEGALLRKERI
jgi:hypothetical protein